MLLIENFIDPGSCASLRARILAMPFLPGGLTATGAAAGVKHNLQLDRQKGRRILDEIAARLTSDPRVEFYAVTKRIAAMSVNRYDVGMEYGNHTDAPFMDGHRCDVSFTLFLEDGRNYEGGELVLEQEHGSMRVKPAMGALFIYPTGLVHRVTPVTKGSRLACIGWIESRLRDDGKRAILRDVNFAQRAYLARHGQDDILDALLKTQANLMRMWCE